MGLHHFLTSRDAVNLLKFLYQKEVIEKASYSYKLSDARKETDLTLGSDVISVLQDDELVTTDDVEGETFLSITAKGKEIIEVFDQLVEVYRGDLPQMRQAGVRVRYELTKNEKRVLLLATKIAKENNLVYTPLRTLTQEMFPQASPSKKLSLVSRYVTKLEELNLVHRKREEKKSFIAVTDQGYKAIERQYMKGIAV